MKYILILLLFCSCAVKQRARKTYDWNHQNFARTVLDVKPNLLFTIVAPQYRPDKKQTFYIGVSISHNDTVLWIPENSIRKVHLIWVERMGEYIQKL